MQVYTSAPYVLSTCAVELLDKKLDEHAAAVRERALGSRSVAEYCKRQDLDFCIAIPLEDLRKIKQTYVHRVFNVKIRSFVRAVRVWIHTQKLDTAFNPPCKYGIEKSKHPKTT